MLTPMETLDRDALIDRILEHLRELTGRRFEAADIELTSCPGQEPNWTVSVEGADQVDVDRTMQDLAEYDLAVPPVAD